LAVFNIDDFFCKNHGNINNKEKHERQNTIAKLLYSAETCLTAHSMIEIHNELKIA
jgi:hypothetical protein